jgi:hypothetical protein
MTKSLFEHPKLKTPYNYYARFYALNNLDQPTQISIELTATIFYIHGSIDARIRTFPDT